MKIVIAGGSGQLGQLLARHYVSLHHEVIILSRRGAEPAGRWVAWDGAALGSWAAEIDGADVGPGRPLRSP